MSLLRKHWIVFLLIALAIGIRVHDLDPVFYYGDDAQYGIVAERLAVNPFALAYPHLNPIEANPPVPFVSQPPLVLYFMALGYAIFGATDIVGIYVSIAFGAATIPVVYATGVAWRGRVLGTLAALFLAVMPFHVNISRRAMLDAGFVFFIALAMLLVVLWMREVGRVDAEGRHAHPKRARKYAVATGVAMGAAVMSKLPGIFILPIVGLALLFVVVLEGIAHAKRDTQARARLKSIAVHVGLAFIPLVGFAIAYFLLIAKLNGLPFLFEKLHFQLARVDPTFAPEGFEEIAAMERPWHWYFTAGKQSIFAMMGGWLVLLAAIGMIVGVVDSLRKPREHGPAFAIVAWVAVFMAFLIYSSRKEWFYLAPIAPALTLLAARVPDAILPAAARVLEQRASVANRATGAFAVVASLLLVGVPTGQNFDESHDIVTDVRDKVFGYGTKEAAYYIADRSEPGDGQIGTLLGRWALHYYNGQPTYHFYQQGMLKRLIHMGEIRWFVEDEYLELRHEETLWYKIKSDCEPELATTFEKSWGKVYVWEFQPGRCRNPDEPIFIAPPAGF